MNSTNPMTKAARQAQVAAVLARVRVRSQEELAAALAQRGVKVTQATLSRDLEDLGAVRLRGPGGALVYALPGEPGGPGSRPGGLAPPAPAGHVRPSPPQAGQVRTSAAPQAGQGPPLPAAGQPPALAQAGGHAPVPASGRTATSREHARIPGAPATKSGAQAPGSTARHSPAGGLGPGGVLGNALSAGAAGAGTAPGGAGPGGGSGQAGAAGTGGSTRTGPEGALGTLPRLAAELLVSAEASANLVVLRTPAGGAQLLAGAIDHAEWPSVLGTVAGDDTVLVITRDPVGGDAVARSLLRLAERRAP